MLRFTILFGIKKQGELKSNLDRRGISFGLRASDMLRLTILQHICQLIRRLCGTSIWGAIWGAVWRRGAGVARRILTRRLITSGVRRTRGASHARVVHNMLILRARDGETRRVTTRGGITSISARTRSARDACVTDDMIVCSAIRSWRRRWR